MLANVAHCGVLGCGQHLVLSSTMGPGVTVDLPYIDPSSGKFMMDIEQLGIKLPE